MRITCERDEILQARYDLVITKQDPPVRESIVSRASEGMTVHNPHENRLSLLKTCQASLVQICTPRDCQPLLLLC